MTPAGTLRRIRVAESTGGGVMVAGHLTLRCALGRSGITRCKHEGDDGTPAGKLRLVSLLYRADRLRRPATALPTAPIRPNAGWCDDPADRRYNRPVAAPYGASHERLWRDDPLYDLLVILDYNLIAPIPGRGSAIFLHLAAPGFSPTAGCIAVTELAMRRILARSGPATVLDIG